MTLDAALAAGSAVRDTTAASTTDRRILVGLIATSISRVVPVQHLLCRTGKHMRKKAVYRAESHPVDIGGVSLPTPPTSPWRPAIGRPPATFPCRDHGPGCRQGWTGTRSCRRGSDPHRG